MQYLFKGGHLTLKYSDLRFDSAVNKFHYVVTQKTWCAGPSFINWQFSWSRNFAGCNPRSVFIPPQ